MRMTPTGWRTLGAFGVAAAIQLAGTLLIPGFSAPFAIRAMLVLATLLAVASVGQTLVILLGGIDLSIPFVIGFANIMAAQLYGDGLPFPLVCLAIGVAALLIGALNGLIPAALGVHPLIVTLGTGTAVLGGALLWTAGFPSGSVPDYVTRIVSIGETVGPLPVPWLVPGFALVAAILVVVLARTPYGRRLYAYGSNPVAAPLALVSPVALWVATFAVSALFAAIAGVLLLGFSGAAYGGAGEPYLFQTIAAVVIGGTALVGGRGGFVGTIAGCLVLIQTNALLIGLGLSAPMIQAALGLVIILLVSLYGREAHVRTAI